MRLFNIVILFFIIYCTNNEKQNDKQSNGQNIQDSVFYISGRAKYERSCQFCHERGGSGAPPLWDTKAWENIYDKGLNQLVQNTLNGYTGEKGTMPPRGGCFKCSKEEIEDAVKFMLYQAKVYPPQDSNL